MDLGGLAAYLVYVRQSAMPLNQFTQQINFILSALAGAERIFEMMHEEPEIDEGSVTLVPAERKRTARSRSAHAIQALMRGRTRRGGLRCSGETSGLKT